MENPVVVFFIAHRVTVTSHIYKHVSAGDLDKQHSLSGVW